MDEVTTTEETLEAETVETPEAETVDWKAEAEKWKELSRKTERQAKANALAAKELEEIKRSQLSDQERLVEQTREETRRAVKTELASQIVDAELKASLNGRVLDGGALIGFDKSRFIDEDGAVDSEAISAWVESNSTKADAPKPDLGQGSRGNKALAMVRTRDELANMSPAEILAAKQEGRLDAIMGKLS
jgi:uncharacterized membrane protein YqiK